MDPDSRAQHQLVVYKRKSKKPRLRNSDRLFWSLLSKSWRDWASELILVFIRRISSDHPEYGEDRIALELEVKFGIRHASSTVRRYMVKRRSPSDSQAWRTFLKNQAKVMWTCDFFVQHTVGFRVLYVLVIMELGSREIIHYNVSEHPTLEWTKQQVRNACFEEQPKFLIHDNDGKFGQLGRPLRVECAGKKVSCRSAYDAWLWRVMGIRLERQFRSHTEHPTQRRTSSD